MRDFQLKANLDDVDVLVPVRLRLHDPFDEIGFDYASFHQRRDATVKTLQCLSCQFASFHTLLRPSAKVVINVEV